MKRDFHFSFYSRIFVLAIIGFGFFMLLQQVRTDAEVTGIDQPFEFSGWAWSPNIGWVSLNCLNDFDGDGDQDNSCLSGGGTGVADYGYSLDVSGVGESERAIKGCGWAGNIGWYICFSDPCYDGTPGSECTLAPVEGIYLNDYYPGSFTPTLTGLPAASQVINSTCHSGDEECHPSILFFEDPGDVWTHEFGFPIGTSLGAGEVNGCFNCQTAETKECVGGDNDGDACTVTSPDCDNGGTCEVVDVQYSCDNCLQYDYDVAGTLTAVTGGYQCTNCNNFDDTVSCQANAYQANSNTCNCAQRYSTPGLMVDYTQDVNGMGSMCGWAWHAYYDDPDYYGVGWLQFSPRITTSTQPYFAVEGGNIYSRGDIRSAYPPPFNKYNAYIIESSGNTIQNLFSYNTTTPSLLTNRPNINFPTPAGNGKYVNDLGEIDVDGLITTIGSTGKNKYGMVVDTDLTVWENALSSGTPVDLNNKVYYYSGAWVFFLSQDIEINNDSGTGIIVVDGSLLIGGGHAFNYNNNIPSSIKDIASLVWVVKGDVDIFNDMTETPGTFVILGRDGVSCPDIFCGKLNTSNGGNPLTIYGSVLAKQFNLDRPTGIGGEPSEKFVNDGRLRINPPAGLTDFAKNMPIFNLSN